MLPDPNINQDHQGVDGSKLREKNFGLSESEFTQMVVELQEGDDRLFERIYLAQFQFCQGKLMTFDGMREYEAYDATMEALLYFRRLLIEEKIGYGNLRYLFVRIARQQYTRSRSKLKVIQGVTADELNLADTANFTYEETNFQELDRAFRQLGDNCRYILHEYYFNRRSLQSLAEEEGRASAALRKQKSRCIQRLRKLCSLS